MKPDNTRNDREGRRRVLVVSSMYPTDQHPAGGIFVHEQVKALIRLGLDVRVATGRPVWMSVRRYPRAHYWALRSVRERWSGWQLHDGVPVARFPYAVGAFAATWMHPWLYAAGLGRWLPELTASFAYDLVHTHTAFLDGRAGHAAARRRGVPMVLTEHMGPLRVVTADRMRRVSTQAGVDAADQLIAVSQALREDMIQQLNIRDPRHLQVVPNGVDTSFFDPACVASMSAVQDAWFDPHAINALWVGHHVQVKRVDRLLRAFAIARRHEPRLRLTLLGSGELEAAMRQLASELAVAPWVRFLPAADRAGVRARIAEADFLVLASESETFGVVVIEALAMGRPVLATRCGGPEDILDTEHLGRLAGNTMEDIALSLQCMASGLDRFDRHRIRRTTVERYDFANVAQRLDDIYAGLPSAARTR